MPIPSPRSKVTAFLKAGFARITYAWRKGVHFSGEEGKEGGSNLVAFHKKTPKTKTNKKPNKKHHHKTTPLEKASEKVTTQGLVHPTAWSSVTKTV